jgi:hypothetical protein
MAVGESVDDEDLFSQGGTSDISDVTETEFSQYISRKITPDLPEHFGEQEQVVSVCVCVCVCV